MEEEKVPRSQIAEFVGESPAMLELFRLIERVGRTRATVLIRGESGVGKELVAGAIHHASDRAERPYVVVDCAALHENLLQSELFGHERGAYTGAAGPKRGLFEVANGGTLFLDEIGELSPELQVMLLRVLESGTFRRLGGLSAVRVDVRVVAATNRRLEDMIQRGDFREDLFHRLNVFPIDVPPLRERSGDVPHLVQHFISRSPTPGARVSGAALERLAAYRWPGNVRELQNVVDRALILTDGDVIEPSHLPLALQRFEAIASPSAEGPALALRDLEIRHVLAVLERFHGHRERSAAALGISERTLYRRLRQVGHRTQRGPGAAPGPSEPVGSSGV